MKINPPAQQALRQLWRTNDDEWRTSTEGFFNAVAANALVRRGLFERQPAAFGSGPRYRITAAGRAYASTLFSKAGGE